ncbi:helitron_like_N domain-containing protein [Trichonephila clavipes]|nr:helitron_like_N domain-containing protein [Trichonephila clavipes]
MSPVSAKTPILTERSYGENQGPATYPSMSVKSTIMRRRFNDLGRHCARWPHHVFERGSVTCEIRRLRYDGSYDFNIGQVINVPVDVDTMMQQLPRQLDDDQTFNVNIKKNMIHKSMYLSGVVKKSVVKASIDKLQLHHRWQYYLSQVAKPSESLYI